jgi:hypothetical protein
MKDQIVDLEITVDYASSIFWLSLRVPEERKHLIDMRNLAHRLMALNIHCFGLRIADHSQSSNLPVVEPRGLTKVLQPNIFGADPVEFRQRSNCIMPPVQEILTSLKTIEPPH